MTRRPVRRRIDNAMVKAIARAFRWREMLENGTYATIAEIAAAEKINETYVGRVLRLTPFFFFFFFFFYIIFMYLRCNRRLKDGKEHRYWNIVESKRCAGGKVVQRQVLYLGEINDSQREAWCRVIEAFDEDSQRARSWRCFPADRAVPEHAKAYGVQVRLDAMQLHRPRQWGACWLACHLYEQLELDRFWAARLPDRAKARAGGIFWRPGVLPADRSGQRMALAPAVV